MNPELIIFAIRSLIRLGREGSAAIDQYERDKAALFPNGISAGFDRVDFITEAFIPDHQELLHRQPLAALWRDNAPAPDVPGAEQTLFAAAVQLKANITKTAGVSSERAISIGGAVMIKQWASGKGPLSPIARIGITIADIGLEFVGTNPSVLGVGGTGGKLIGGLAANLSGLIPDDGEQFGPKTQFAERAIGIFLRAGLTTMSEQSGLLIRKEDMQQLVKNSLKPVIDALPTTLAEQSRWHDVTDALLGPAASTALGAIAANPRAFFGRDFDAGTAIGALTKALLGEASKTGLKEQFSQAGLIALYKAALGIVAERPELFLGRTDKQAEQIASDLLGRVATTLKDASPPFDSDLGIDLAVDVLDALKTHGPAFIDKNNPWENVVGLMVLQVVDGLKNGLGADGGGIKNLLSRQQLSDLAGIFLKQAAQTPGMLAGGNTELQQIVQGVAQALSQDTQMLLTPEGWLSVASAVATEALANPQRLFKGTALGGGIGTLLIGDLLSVAQAAGGRAQGGVLFGPTLRDAIIIAVQAAAGNVDAVATNQAALKDLAQQLTDLVQTRSGQLGSKEWLWLYRVLIGRVLQSGALGTIDDAQIEQILKGAFDQ
jgi:hypothetical protein